MSDRDDEITTVCDAEECDSQAIFKDQFGHNYCLACRNYHGSIDPRLVFEYLQGRG